MENKDSLNVVITQSLTIEIEIKDLKLPFHFPYGASYKDCYDSLQEAGNQIMKLAQASEDAHKKAQEPEKEEDVTTKD